ncbi:REP-associated tyrosine transposase [Lysobacter arvi]|uniref:Transposase n=1 Tax=Lysobacter arvi TaxID=3038776 RepID=A0ABU1CBU5_9GAMM|nr:transposase [Lysobacter arvi]MDR0181537.1 transposase [Lysobacter arvi]
MSNYRRAWSPGGTWFFTVALLNRRGNNLLVREIDLLRRVVAGVMARHPFRIHGWVVLLDHLHCVIELPHGDTDFPRRWRLIKGGFSKGLPKAEYRSAVRVRRGERGIWQRRYWEHLIRDEADYRAHMDYVHINPLKHGLVQRIADWPYSTFYSLVAEGIYPADWQMRRGLRVCRLMIDERFAPRSDGEAAQCYCALRAIEGK